MKPLIRQSTPEEDEAAKREAEREARRQRDSDAWDRVRKDPLNLPEVAPPPDWQGRMFPAGTPNPRDALIADYRALREQFEPPVPPEYRQFLGPPPSSANSRLYEHLRKETARELAAQLRNYPGHEETTRKGPPIDPN
jgi:hypothetical protein